MGYLLDTDGIAWSYDTHIKYKQVDGFVSSIVTNSKRTCEEVFGSSEYSNCKSYTNSYGVLYYYWYPNDNNIQYLYETYGSIISPLEGNLNSYCIGLIISGIKNNLKHFVVLIIYSTLCFLSNNMICNLILNSNIVSV